jgi:chromosome segregation ATPase
MVEPQILAVRLEALHSDMGEMKAVLAKLSDAVTKLALIEQSQGQAAEALERAFKMIEKIETRVAALEQSQPKNDMTSAWMERILVGIVGFAAAVIAAKFGLM